MLGLRRDRLHVLLHLLALALVLQPEGLVLDDALGLGFGLRGVCVRV